MIKEIPDITEPVEVFGFSTARDLVNQTLNFQNLTKQYKAYDEPNIPSGFGNIDKLTRGFRRGEITTISTRPGNGKTAFMLSLIQNIAVILERRLALFSPERSAGKVISRLIESNTSHSLEKIRQDLLREDDKEQALSLILPVASAGLFIDDSSNLDAHEMVLRCHQACRKHHAEIIFVDSPEIYTSHIHDTECRKSASEEIFLSLKNIAHELDVPVVIFFQAPKPASVNNGGLMPSMNEIPSYLAENSDNVIFIHRPEYYQRKNKSVPAGTVELIVNNLHQKENSQFTYLKFIESIDRFVNPDEG